MDYLPPIYSGKYSIMGRKRPEYRRQGLATEIVSQYLRRESPKDRKKLLLTCLESKVKMYEKMGFQNNGIAHSTWGGEQWYEMSIQVNE